MVEVRGVFLDTFLLGVLAVLGVSGVLIAERPADLAGVLLAEAEWKDGVMSLERAVLSA